jgi:hypothetical protein
MLAGSRRFRPWNSLSDSDPPAALTVLGRTLAQGRPIGTHRPGSSGAEQYRVIVRLPAGRDLTRAQMIDILLGRRVPGKFRDRPDELGLPVIPALRVWGASESRDGQVTRGR